MKKYLFLALFICTAFSLKAQKMVTITADNNAVYTSVEVEPLPPNGIANFYKFLTDHIKYPAKEKADHVQGKVIMQFVVEKDGSLTDIKVLRTPAEALAAEAIRVVKAAGNWTPGIQGGKKVRVQFVIPVNFVL